MTSTATRREPNTRPSDKNGPSIANTAAHAQDRRRGIPYRDVVQHDG